MPVFASAAHIHRALTLLWLTSLIAACSDPEPLPPPPPDVQLGRAEPRTPPATLANALAGASRGPLSVQVREVRQAGTYSVLEVGDSETQGQLIAPAIDVEVGAMISVADYVLRRGFSLEGVGAFDAVLIGTRVTGPGVRSQLHLVGAGARLDDLPPGHPPAPEQGVPLAEMLTPTADRIEAIRKGLPTIAELRASRDELAWREVAVRGLITGRTLGALGRNWLRIEDGSGGVARLSLLVSTQAAPPLGELVRAQGMLHIYDDVGAGVVHPVLLAEATVTVDNEADSEPAGEGDGAGGSPDKEPGNGAGDSPGAAGEGGAATGSTPKAAPTPGAKPRPTAAPATKPVAPAAAPPSEAIPPPPDEPVEEEEP